MEEKLISKEISLTKSQWNLLFLFIALGQLPSPFFRRKKTADTLNEIEKGLIKNFDYEFVANALGKKRANYFTK